ncbi:MAG: hypothetical protein ABI837_05775 [Acidobacteriota bacterium]
MLPNQLLRTDAVVDADDGKAGMFQIESKIRVSLLVERQYDRGVLGGKHHYQPVFRSDHASFAFQVDGLRNRDTGAVEK